MKIQMMKLADIRPYEGNPRINDEAIKRVAASFEAFGVRQPIVVDSEKVIVVGHTRYHAALLNGMGQFPVHVAKDLTPEQTRLYRIADNRTAEFSDWDYEKLRKELETVGETEIDLGGLGMTIGDWPELNVPDFEGLGVDTDESAGVRAPLLSVGKYRIALTEAELASFMGAIESYTKESGTMFGFGRWLLNKAGIEVREEVTSDEGQVATLV